MSKEPLSETIDLPPLPLWMRLGRWVFGIAVSAALFLMVWLTSQVSDPEPKEPTTFESASVLLPPPPPVERIEPERKPEKPTPRKLESLRDDSPLAIKLLEVKFEPKKEERLMSKVELDLDSFEIDVNSLYDAKAFERSEVDRPPEALFRSMPSIPSRKGRDKEIFRLMFVVTDDGKVENPYVIDSTYTEVNQQVIEEVRRWQFRPAYKGNRPVRCWARVKVIVNPESSSPFSL